MALSKSELQDIRSLLTRKGRINRHEFIAEGVRLMEEALRHRFPPKTVYISNALLTVRGEELAARFRQAHVEVVEISAKQLEAISDTASPQGIVGLFSSPIRPLEELYAPQLRKVLLCENISDPGNLGTLIRSALAFEMQAVIAVGSCAELYSPKVVRSSAGAVFGMALGHYNWDEVNERMKSLGATLVATDLNANDPVERLGALASDKAVVLAVGSEATGLSDEIMACADVRIRIRHSEAVDSLNAAVAGSVLMRELYQERR